MYFNVRRISAFFINSHVQRIKIDANEGTVKVHSARKHLCCCYLCPFDKIHLSTRSVMLS